MVDIDVYVPFSVAGSLLQELQRWIIWGPDHYRDESWDLTFLKLDFNGQRIEIADSDSSPQFFDRTAGRWIPQDIHHAQSVEREVLGVQVDVMPLQDLLDYKQRLRRWVDLEDLREMRAIRG